MTPEERTAELCERSDGLVSPKGSFASLIDSTIRAAENEAYERAADICRQHHEIDALSVRVGGLICPYVDPPSLHKAALIRSLKHKDPQ